MWFGGSYRRRVMYRRWLTGKVIRKRWHGVIGPLMDKRWVQVIRKTIK
ncbi:hypothetical protein A2U01_0066804, partial [Trifolium medium]|nr:hypothetical protein [Trifolium medium]